MDSGTLGSLGLGTKYRSRRHVYLWVATLASSTHPFRRVRPASFPRICTCHPYFGGGGDHGHQ